MRPFHILGILFLILFGATTLHGQTQHPEPRRGVYAGLLSGPIYFTSGSDRAKFQDGWVVGLKLGYDIGRFFSLKGEWRTSGHDSTGAAGIPEAFFGQQFLGSVTTLLPLTTRLSLFADFGGGIWLTSPNIRPNLGPATRGIGIASLGLQYFLRTQGLAMGLDPSVSYAEDLDGLIFQGTAFVRYTF